MYYIREEGGTFRKTGWEPVTAIICGWQKQENTPDNGHYIFTSPRNNKILEFYSTEAALSALEEAIKENMKKHDELISQHLCILEGKAIAEPDSEQ